MFGVYSKSYSSLPLSPPSSRSTTFIRWFWRSKSARILVLVYLSFSVVFSLLHIFEYTGRPFMPLPQKTNTADLRIFRTYDTKGISPLDEMKNSVRFNKMHSKMSQFFTDSVHPYYLRGENTPETDDITTIAFVTENRLGDLLRLAEMWRGPISATFHIPAKTIDEKDPIIHKSLSNLRKFFTENPILRQNVDLHIVAGPISLKQNPNVLPRPTNFHLNVARFFVRSEFVAYIDHDTWPTSSTREIIKNQKNLLLQNDVIILPTFIFNENSTTFELPTTTEDVKKLIEEGSMGLQDDGWELNRGVTDYESWKQGKLYMIQEYELHYRPNFVSRKGGSIPWCTERFDDNKAACLFQIYISGSELWVVPDAFLIRHHLNPKSHLLIPDESKWAKGLNSRMYTRFYRESCIHYGRQLLMAGDWETAKAQHLKQECSRVLTNSGKGLIEKTNPFVVDLAASMSGTDAKKRSSRVPTSGSVSSNSSHKVKKPSGGAKLSSNDVALKDNRSG
ncbi:hypothetical protein G9A89_005081 [Geosiphon pyriformis]|nr:hypothetical protein G9A89_005081 [Geosiphon pyriformis]